MYNCTTFGIFCKLILCYMIKEITKILSIEVGINMYSKHVTSQNHTIYINGRRRN